MARGEIRVEFPKDIRVRKIIDSLAKFVAKNGAQLERMVSDDEWEKEYKDGVQPFAFLYDRDSNMQISDLNQQKI